MNSKKYNLIVLLVGFLSPTIKGDSTEAVKISSALINQFNQNHSERQQNDGVDQQGNTDLHDYAKWCSRRIFNKYMMMDGITLKNLKTKNKDGKTPEDILKEQGKPHPFSSHEGDCEFLRNAIAVYLKDRGLIYSDVSPEETVQEIKKLLDK